MKFECSEGHEWSTTPASIIYQNTWCPHCAGNACLTISDMQRLAGLRGGKCLSQDYQGSNKHLLWECCKGHRWRATPGHLKHDGTWCPQCAGNLPTSFDEINKIALSKGGECLSSDYQNNSTELVWKCSLGHVFSWSLIAVKTGSWCPTCRGNSIEALRDIALSRGGDCLSRKYVTSKTKLQWTCQNGHKWHATPDSIKRGSWCPKCYSFYSEEICRAYFEQLFCLPFPKVRPKWLVGGKGRLLELDGYCETLKLAFEFNGPHHKKEEVRRRDKFKQNRCNEMGITLLVIEEGSDLTSLSGWIKNSLEKQNFVSENVDFSKTIDFTKVYLNASYLSKIHKYVEGKGGKCLSKWYLDASTKMTFECENGHNWQTVPSSVLNGGHWCPHCAGNAKDDIANMEAIAKKNGGKCISNRYKNSNSKLTWECAKGHQWKALPSNVKRGSWCPKCAGVGIKNIEEMQKIAERNGGKCISKRYKNSHSKLTWECKQGHKWSATPSSIARGSWCAKCAGNVKLSIYEMRQLASSKGGRCISSEYQNQSTKLIWECENGHQWKATPLLIKHHNSWCPECRKSKK
jgi:hypothetical protein